jgi:hypothetical protein
VEGLLALEQHALLPLAGEVEEQVSLARRVGAVGACDPHPLHRSESPAGRLANRWPPSTPTTARWGGRSFAQELATHVLSKPTARCQSWLLCEQTTLEQEDRS